MSSNPVMKMHPHYARLEAATDAARMKGLIEAELRGRRGNSLGIADFWVTRVFPRRNGRFVIQYEVNLGDFAGGKRRRVYYCGALLGPEEEWPWYARPDNENVIILNDIRMVVPVFPFDPKIKYLSKIIDSLEGDDPDEMSTVLPSTICGGKVVTDYETLGYRLERRCVVRCALVDRTADAGDPQPTSMILKLFRQGRGLDPVRRLRWLTDNGFRRGESGRLTVPEVYHYDDDKGLAIMEDAPGVSLHLLLGDSSFEEACRTTAILLSRLHALEPTDVRQYSMADELETLRQKIELCGNVFPSVRERLREAYGRLTSERKCFDDKASAAVHGDFHDKQILYSRQRSTLLDCDDMKFSDPGLDYGNFLAHLGLRRIQSPELAVNIERGVNAFVEAYNSKSEGLESRAMWWAAAAFLRLAVIYSLRPRWRAITPEIIKTAVFVLERKTTKYGGVDAFYPK